MITIETIDANKNYSRTPDWITPTAVVLVIDKSNPKITQSALSQYSELGYPRWFVMDSSDFEYAIRRMTTTKITDLEIGRTEYTVSDTMETAWSLLTMAPHSRICTPLLLNVIEDVEEDLIADSDEDYNDFKLAVWHSRPVATDTVMRLVSEIAGYAGVETNITMYGDDQSNFINQVYVYQRTEAHHKGHLLKPIIGKALMTKYAVFYPKED